MKNGKNKPLGQGDANKDHQKIVPIFINCACNRDITLDELAEAYPDRKMDTIKEYIDNLNMAMKHYEINSCLRKAHFLAQVGHESGELQYTAEQVPADVEKKVYGGYKGRGLIQLTGEKNYIAYGKYIGQDLKGENRFKVAEAKLATDSAGWFWIAGKGKDLNIAADQNDLLYISAEINGGFNGYDGSLTSRLTLLKKAVNALHVGICPQLDALFKAFPEAEKFSYESYPLTKSKAYHKHDMAFAWGYWHDPKSKMHGTHKIVEEAKLGYGRYLELLKIKPDKSVNLPKNRFGFGRAAMKMHAEKRLKELLKN